MKIRLWPSGHSSYYTAVYFFETPLAAKEKALKMTGIADCLPTAGDDAAARALSDRGIVLDGEKLFLSFEGLDGMTPEHASDIAKAAVGDAPRFAFDYAQHLVVEIEVGDVPKDVVPLLLNKEDQALIGAFQRLTRDKALVRFDSLGAILRIDYLGENVYTGGGFWFEDGTRIHPGANVVIKEIKVTPR